MNNKINSNSISQQRGATLIVSLVILAVITLLGVASMRSSNLQLKMATSARDRAVAVQAAEAALSGVERNLASPIDYPVESFLPGCNGTRCFTPTCLGGRCFSGDIQTAINRDDCSLADINPITGLRELQQHWRNDAVWRAGGSAVAIQVVVNDKPVPADRLLSVLYLVEFMCFVPKNEDTIVDVDHSKDLGVPLFQVTVRARGEAGRATVMLQSTFRGTSTK